jgi:hypothetical protein
MFNRWLHNVTPILRRMTFDQKNLDTFNQTLITIDRNNFIEGMDLNGNHDLNFYNGCVYGKHHHTLFPLNEGSCAKEILGHVHRDLCGFMATSHGRAKYFLTFIDDFFRKTFSYTMKIKFGKFDKLKIFKAWVEN